MVNEMPQLLLLWGWVQSRAYPVSVLDFLFWACIFYLGGRQLRFDGLCAFKLILSGGSHEIIVPGNSDYVTLPVCAYQDMQHWHTIHMIDLTHMSKCPAGLASKKLSMSCPEHTRLCLILAPCRLKESVSTGITLACE